MNGCTVSTICGKELDWNQGHVEDAKVSGVFAPLINSAAFVDRLVLGIKGKLRKRINPLFTITRNPAIGGPRRPYARSMHGIFKPTGNPFEVKYGPNPMYPNLFDAKLILRSEGTAISYLEVMEILSCLFRKGQRNTMRGIEFTSDVSVPLRIFENHLLTRARSIRTRSTTGGEKRYMRAHRGRSGC